MQRYALGPCLVQHQGHKNKNFPIRSTLFKGAKYVHSQVAHDAQQPSRTPGSALSFDRSLLVATGSLDKVYPPPPPSHHRHPPPPPHNKQKKRRQTKKKRNRKNIKDKL